MTMRRVNASSVREHDPRWRNIGIVLLFTGTAMLMWALYVLADGG
jgi:hypothetical protein